MVKMVFGCSFLAKKIFFATFAANLKLRFMAFVLLLLYAALVFVTIKFKQVYTPAGVMVFLWTALNATLLIFFRDMVELKYSGLFYILAGVSLFLIGAFIAHKTAKNSNSKVESLCFNSTLITPFLVGLTLLGMVHPFYCIYAHGFSICDLFSVESITNMTKTFSRLRYVEDTSYSSSIQFFLIFTYTAPILGGFSWLLVYNKYQKLLCILTILPCLIITLSQSTKMQAITAAFLWIGGFFTSVFSYNIKLKFNYKTIIVLASLLALFIVGLFYSLLTRWGEEVTDDKFDRNKTTFFDYSFGSLMCFDEWFHLENNGTDYSTTLIQNSKLGRLGFFRKVENGVHVDFNPPLTKPVVETYGRFLTELRYDSLINYTIQFEVKCNVKPDSVKVSLFSNNAHPKGHYLMLMENEKQVGLNRWYYSHTFSLDSSRSNVRTPDIILSLDSAKYFEITKLRIDTGTVAQPWVNGSGNMFYRDNSLKYGVMTFFGVANALGIAKRQSGIYRDFVYFGRLDKTMRSNVYTIFRMLIDDFGIVGALVFLLLLGFASAKAIVFIKKRKMIFLSQAFLVAVYSYVMWGFVASIWAYTSIICAYGLTFLIFSILQKPLHGDTWVTKIAKILKPKKK